MPQDAQLQGSRQAHNAQQAGKTEAGKKPGGFMQLTEGAVLGKLHSALKKHGLADDPEFSAHYNNVALSIGRELWKSQGAGNLEGRAERVAASLARIAKAGARYSLNMFEGADTASKLVSNPELFTDVCSISGKGAAPPALKALANNRVWEFFGSSRKEAEAAFRHIAGWGSYSAFEMFGNDTLAEMLASNPKTTLGILDRLHTYSGNVMDAACYDLGNKDIAPLFAGNPDAFLEIAKAAKGERCFWPLQLEPAREMFISSPQTFVEMAQAAGKQAGGAFAAFRIAAGERQNTSAAAPDWTSDLKKLFYSDPAKLVRALRLIAKAAGRDSDTLFYDLSFGRFVLAVAEKPRIADALAAVMKNSGERNSQASTLGYLSRMLQFFSEKPDAFVALSNELKAHTCQAIRALEYQPLLKNAFAENPGKLTSVFARIAKYSGKNADYAFEVLQRQQSLANADDPKKAADFAVSLANAFGENAQALSSALEDNHELEGAFFSGTAACIKAARNVLSSAARHERTALQALGNKSISGQFVSYLNGGTPLETLMTAIKSSDAYAIELGRPLDDLHERDSDRAKYLASLSGADVLCLLLSKPEYFYTSTNNMLFDRLLSDSRGSSTTSVLEKYGAGEEQQRNLIFRAMNYGRYCGTGNSIFTQGELPGLAKVVAGPLQTPGFDPTYFYLLANSLEAMDERLRKHVGKALVKSQAAALTAPDGEWPAQKAAACAFLMKRLQDPGQNDAKFDARKYRGKDGKLLIVQVFDRKDTVDRDWKPGIGDSESHWQKTVDWFSKYASPKTAKDGEIAFETAGERIILFMGKDERENQEFLKAQLAKSPNMILTFRGHSFSLMKNLPADVFGNRRADILFIPGSCGSAGSVPAYIGQNRETSFDFISNNSTGRGQVTNAVLDILIAEARSGVSREYGDIMRGDLKNEELIRKQDGDPQTLKAATLGEKLLAHAYGRRL